MRTKLNPSQLKLLKEKESAALAEKRKWKYTQACKYCGEELAINSSGEEIGVHHCEVSRDVMQKIKIDELINNRQHNMLIHGFLMAIQHYAAIFGLHSTAAVIIRESGIQKEDLIRCQIESDSASDIMLPLIESAFNN